MILSRLFALLLIPAATVALGQTATTRDVSFPSDGLSIPGTLTMPTGTAPAAGVPLVVLVQGSGPSDRDETIGPNKVFKDLAEALAARGIATLRYDKRTWLWKTGAIKLAAGEDLKVTLEVEVVDDAVAALGFGARQPGIDPKQVFVLGHSLGGTMAPRIAAVQLKAVPGSVRGVIEMAGAAIPANVILPYQTAFQGLLRGKGEDATQKDVAMIDASFANALDPSTDPMKRILFAPAAYLREWAAVDAAGDLRALGLPALVLHGAKDVQVGYPDYVLLKQAAGAPGSQAREFAGLNHLMMAVDGESTGSEYAKPGHVDAAVTAMIADWVLGLR